VLVQANFNGDTFADITWANHAIQNEWLQVTVLADANTHLAELRRNSPSAGVRGEWPERGHTPIGCQVVFTSCVSRMKYGFWASALSQSLRS